MDYFTAKEQQLCFPSCAGAVAVETAAGVEKLVWFSGREGSAPTFASEPDGDNPDFITEGCAGRTGAGSLVIFMQTWEIC